MAQRHKKTCLRLWIWKYRLNPKVLGFCSIVPFTIKWARLALMKAMILWVKLFNLLILSEVL